MGFGSSSPAIAIGGDAARIALCLHCGSAVPASRRDGYCCAGCMAVHRLLSEAGLEAYYHLRPTRIRPLLDYFERRHALDWLEAHPGAESGHLDLAVEGIQCAACVWAIEKLARREGLARLGINAALGRLSLRFDPERFDVRAYLEVLADFGYRVRPADEVGPEGDPSRGLMLRLGICTALALNTMSFALPFYLGLADTGGPLQAWLQALALALTTASVAVGGSYFFGRAWQALRHGIAHFDIPVALGILAAYSGSVWAYFQGRPESLYFDSVNLFIALMLLGRFLQERTLVSSRRQLLDSESFAHATVTLLDPRPVELAWTRIQRGQRLLLQPGSRCPVAAEILPDAGGASERASESIVALEFDLASLTGERQPIRLGPGDALPAGARLLSNQPARLLATTDFNAAALAGLLPAERGSEELPVLWRWSVKVYTIFVLTAAFSGLAWWWPRGPQQALQVFIAVLVVTCPCGLGIAVPLARSLADQRLARLGLTLRRPALLERLLGLRQIWLDKTGTLTLSDLELEDAAPIAALDDAARRALMGAAGASRHPVSRALYRELSARGLAYPEAGIAREIPGEGVSFEDASGSWFLGRAMNPDGLSRAELRRGDRVIAEFALRERSLMDGPASIARLRAMGLRLGLLSGDEPGRVAAMALELGLAPEEARARCSPQDKADAVALQPSLMLGDGLNDALALAGASVSGSPNWEHSPLADRSDFSFGSGSLAWLPELFATARALRRALWANLVFAWTYNLVLVSLALAGLISPLVCALTMPASSLLVSLATTRMLAR
jgi:Cu2+-exporting ATPase